jgi:3-deoxy-7-phosphoheptulonate synthase
LVARHANPQGTHIRVGPVEIGGEGFAVIAGPCAVETETQIRQTAAAVAAAGAHLLRGGAFKPRTSPYSFQGLGEPGLQLLAAAGREQGLPVITEVLGESDVALVAHYADVLQVGARNMQNFALLKALGATGKPVLLKRGLAATLDELMFAAEYIVHSGNPAVMLCERGIRSFETATRNTLDLNAVALLKQWTHLPVLVDPSHGTGRRALVAPLAKAAVAAGADGVIIEVHPDPEHARSDGEQSLTPNGFADLMHELACQVPLSGRTLAPGPAETAGHTGDLRACRERIDRLDEALVRLLHARVRIARRLGERKLAAGLPLKSSEREAEVMQRVAAMADAILSAESLGRVFRAIMEETLESERAAA